MAFLVIFDVFTNIQVKHRSPTRQQLPIHQISRERGGGRGGGEMSLYQEGSAKSLLWAL